jgi:hypothetical protein
MAFLKAQRECNIKGDFWTFGIEMFKTPSGMDIYRDCWNHIHNIFFHYSIF